MELPNDCKGCEYNSNGWCTDIKSNFKCKYTLDLNSNIGKVVKKVAVKKVKKAAVVKKIGMKK